MNLYDVLADGYHTPLTKTQITELFQAGRLGRNQPCKQIEKKEWRTVDELFPLLKYDASRSFFDQSAAPPGLQARNRAFAIAISALVISAAAFALYIGLGSEGPASRDATTVELETRSPARVPISSRPVSTAVVNATTSATVPHSNALSRQSQQSRLAQERLAAAQRQREQSQAAQLQLAQDRANAEQRERELQRATGRTERIPLDQFTIVRNVGGLDVPVKIHDRDITTIDVWTSYAGPVQMTKQKGITGSRTDETLIYRNGRAHLYYVWEISGKLNHCLLRVRDE